MRFARFPATRASILTTAVVAAAAGVASVAWTPPSERPLDAAIAQVTEEVEIVGSPAEDLAMEVVTASGAQLVGDEMILETRLENRGPHPVVISETGVLDLSVQKTSSPGPMQHLGEITFLALYEVATTEPVLLLPGQAIRRTLKLAPGAPFDGPGRYEIAGRWLGGDARATVIPFALVINECTGVAARAAKSLRTGA